MAVRVAIVLYFLFAIVQIRQKPGLQYDEALPVMGSVHLRTHPRQDFTLPHDPDTWIHVRTRWFPLMTVRYVGAIKEYLWLPVLAVFGPSTASIRLLSAVLAALGLWGVAFWMRANAGAREAGLAALALAINPSFVAMTVFDNGTVSIFMASLGLLCIAVTLYQRRPTWWTALLVGVAAGFGVWARVNFVWVVVAMAVAAAVVLWRKLLHIPWPHWLAAAGGAVLGCAPLILYQIVSHGGTFEAVGMFSSNDTLGQRLYTRLVMLSESLLCDREHRAMWGGPEMPWWQRDVFVIVLLIAAVVCLRKGGVRRIIAIAFLLFAACLFFSGLPVAEHHLVTLLPFAAALIVLAGGPRWPVLAFAVFYAGCAFYWQTAAVAGLKRTGGEGVWSDGVVTLATTLEKEERAPGKPPINFLDWGFQQNIYVITGGRLPTREILGPMPWPDTLSRGGTYVVFAPGLQQMPETTTNFLAALRETAPLTRTTRIAGRDGSPYADIIDVEPGTLHQGAGARLSTGDPKMADRLEGFYEPESGWRWSRPKFAITLDTPPAAGARALRLSVDIFLPEALIQKIGAVTLSARVGDHALPPQKYSQPGSFTYARELPPEWLRPGPNRVDFAVDKALHGDRELGVVVVSAAIEAVK